MLLVKNLIRFKFHIMKTLFTLLFSFLVLSAQGQYIIDLVNAPKNPIPVEYTLNHFKLAGPVERQFEKVGGFDIEYKFDKKGRVSYSGGTFENMYYTYDTKGFLIGQKNSNATFTFKYNDLGFTIDKKWINGEESGQSIYEYNEKGLYSRKKEISPKGTEITNFTYDDYNRIIKQESLKDGVVVKEITCTYSNMKKLLQVVETVIDKTNGTGESNYYFFDSYREVANPLFGYIPLYDSWGNKTADFDEEYKVYDNQRTYSYYSDTTCYSGNCADGWGLIKTPNGNYEGFFVNGKREGFGLYSWADGGQYVGLWKNDVMEGLGRYQKGTTTIFGEFSNNKLEGRGYKVYEGKAAIGIYENDLIKEEYNFVANGNSTGCIGGDCETKYGKKILPNGEWFEGFFKDGKMYFGDYKKSNGDSYQGMFGPDGTFTGMGRMITANGSFYAGMFSKNKLDGKSYFKNPAGTAVLAGQWKQGEFVKFL